MNIAYALDQFDELSELNAQSHTFASAKRSWRSPYWILLTGILCGLASLALAAVANAQP